METIQEYTARVAQMPVHVLRDEVHAQGRIVAQLGDDVDPSDILFREVARDELRARH